MARAHSGRVRHSRLACSIFHQANYFKVNYPSFNADYPLLAIGSHLVNTSLETRRIANGLMNDFIGPNLQTHFKYLDDLVQPTGWFAGNELSGADFMLQYPMFAARGRAPQYYSKESTPNLLAWTEKIEARPAYQRAMERVCLQFA